VDVLGRGGRYILASSHLMGDEEPVENVVAMYDEARSYRPARKRLRTPLAVVKGAGSEEGVWTSN